MAGHILLAEDDKALSALMQDFFRAAGVAVTPAYDGEQALVLAQAQPFDLLVLDVMMPHLNGLEVCEAVRQESDVPVIFVTALGQEGDTLAGFRAGADDYITKPFSFPVLVAKAQALMRRARGLRLGASELGYANILMDTASGGNGGRKSGESASQGGEDTRAAAARTGTHGVARPAHRAGMGHGFRWGRAHDRPAYCQSA